jgi:Outer membrane cobalamin receptor protein
MDFKSLKFGRSAPMKVNRNFFLGLMLLSLVNVEGMAQGDTTNIVSSKRLDEVVVKATQRKNAFSKLSRVVSTITKEELKAVPIQSVADVLAYAAGVDIRTRGPVGVQADISVRGGSFDQVLILLNGVNITDPQTGHHNLNLPVDISAIERIEILQGPGARSFGPNAFSGAINFITTSSTSHKTRVSVAGGDFGFLSVGAITSATKGDLGVFVSANRQQSSGYVKNTDFEVNNFYGNFSYKNQKIGDLELNAGVQDKGFGANSFYSVKYPNEYEATKTYFNSLRWGKDFGAFDLSATGYWRRHFDRFELFRYDPQPFYKNHNYHRTDVYGGSLKLTIFSLLGKTLVGAEVREEEILSNVLGNPLSKPVKIIGTNLFYTNGVDRLNSSAFLEHSYNYKRLFVSAGLMFNHSNDFGSSWYWGADASYVCGSSGFRLYSSANQSYRLPTFTDLFYQSAVHNGNPNLKPEKAVTYEGGVKYEKGFAFVQASVYRRLADNSIDRVKLPSEDKTTTRNLTDIHTTGVELTASYSPNGKFFKAISTSYTYQTQDKSSSEYISMYVLDYLNYKATLSSTIGVVKNLTLNVRGCYQDRKGTYTNPSGIEVAYDPFFTLDAKLMYTYENISTFAEASNLLNKRYYDLGNIPQPLRWFKAGIAVTF